MTIRFLGPLLLVLSLAVPALAQKRHQDTKETHYRVYAIDRTVTDAKGHVMPAHIAGMAGAVVLGYSPDRKHCLIEYVAANFKDHQALRDEIAAAADPHMKVWEKHFADIEDVRKAAAAIGIVNVDFAKSFARVP